jgi:hypothetical protein
MHKAGLAVNSDVDCVVSVLTLTKDFMKIAIFLAIPVALAVAWVINLVQLIDCDFSAPYKCEVVHIIGLVPVASLVTVWLDTGK